MSDFHSWWQESVNIKEKSNEEDWKNAFFERIDLFDELPNVGKLTIKEESPDIQYDYSFWLKRAFLRNEASLALYNDELDVLEALDISWSVSGTEEDAFLPLTKKGEQSALFLDRDGIINQDHGYVFEKEKVSFVSGIETIIKFAKEKGYKVIVVTNQSGVGRGLYQEEDVLLLHQWMQEELEKKGAGIDGWYYSPYHPESTQTQYKRASYTRKPMPGMALKAANDWNIDFSKSFMIGDKVSDVLVHVDIVTFLLKGNYELGNYPLVYESHEQLLEALKKNL